VNYLQRLTVALGVILVFVLACSASGYIGYIYGEDEGYARGQEVGLESGYGEGQNEGYQTGYSGGQKEGYQMGYSAGVKATKAAGCNLWNPSYQEMKEFVAQDGTDSKTYIGGEYVCSDFAAEVNNNAEAQGIRCALVDVKYPGDWGHAIVAFETTDKGLVFIEPQFDDEVDVVVGASYSQVNGYSEQPHNDTVVRYLVIW